MRRRFSDLEHLRRLLASMGVDEIARRMFVTNSFDSLIATIGIVLGNYVIGTSSPHSYLGSALGGSITMGVFSSFFGVYITEKAERLRELREIEEQLLIEIKDSIYGEVVRLAPIYVALWSMVGSIVFTFLSLSPFFLSIYGAIELNEAIAVSVVISNSMIAVLGAYMGKISGEGIKKSVLKFISLSLSATFFLILISLLGI
ncbi:MAG TPA: hypothetical protein ENO36_00975 [Fervidicoccus fontis]|uniref:VIT family protein n=1 Tax=Fervidicoccus fontis TaxID=683846 RepID=A0A7C2YH00_9CREN|nr:hypothetical protein [Fervidicoccus fontis]